MKLFIGVVLSITQTCYAQIPCEVCGVGLAVTKLDEPVPLPGQNPPITCAAVQQMGREGQIPAVQCAPAIELVFAICGCAPFQPSVAPPSLAPMDDAPTLGPGVHPPCSICGEGMRITLQDPLIPIPGFQLEPTCKEFEDAGFQGQIPASNCPFTPSLVRDLCGCTTGEAPEGTGDMPSLAPVAPPTTLADDVPTLSPGINPPCSICGIGMRITLLDPLVLIPGFTVAPTCEEFEDAGFQGQIPASNCPFTPSLVRDLCGCATGEAPEGTGDMPTLAPTSCSVCGPGREVSLPDAIFMFPGQPSVPCGVLEEMGANGNIPADQCPSLPSIISDVCNCLPVGTPMEPPSITPTPTCTICGEGRKVSSSDAILEGLGEPYISCGTLENEGVAGIISANDCPLFQIMAAEVCNCVPTEVPMAPVVAPVVAPPSAAPMTSMPSSAKKTATSSLKMMSKRGKNGMRMSQMMMMRMM